MFNKLVYLKNSLCLFFHDREREPHKAGAELAQSVEAGLDFAFAADICDRSAEKEVYKDCMLKEFNKDVIRNEQHNS